MRGLEFDAAIHGDGTLLVPVFRYPDRSRLQQEDRRCDGARPSCHTSFQKLSGPISGLFQSELYTFRLRLNSRKYIIILFEIVQ